MRFHCGVSFSWRSIKKFLIPFLLGILAFFGFNFLQDNKIIPLGFIQAYALEDNPIPDEIEDSYYYYSYLNSIEEETNYKPLHNKVYWFDNNTTTNGILSSIYILLFLYCISSLLLKVISMVHNVRWKK